MEMIPKKFFAHALVLAFLVGVPTSSRAVPASKLFKSPQGFTVSYPATWRRIDDGKQLEILALKSHRAKGVIIGDGQAAIVATTGDAERLQRLTSNKNREFGDLHSLKYLSKVEAPACDEAQAFVFQNKIGPAPPFGIPAYGNPRGLAIETYLTCVVRGRLYEVWEEHWAGDRNERRWQAAAWQVFKSLRVDRPTGSGAD
jgi:hypothetical protein